MYDENIISRMNDYLHKAAQALASWLSVMLPKSGEDWWEECVLSNLSYPQRELIEKKGLSKLEELDLAALLRVANKSWYTMRGYAYLPTSERECIRDMIGVRNNWAHVSAELPGKDTIVSDIECLIRFFAQMNRSGLIPDLEQLKARVERPEAFKDETPPQPVFRPTVTAPKQADVIVEPEVVPLFVTFMVLSGILAMFIDSITVILFLAAVTIELSQLLKFNPVPMILAEVFCANLGGSATMCGDPPNIIIGTSLGYSFTDFLTNTGVIAGVSLVVVVLYFYLVFHKELRASEAAAAGSNQTYPDPSEAIIDKKGFIISTIIFLCAVVLLVTHAQTGLTVSCIGVFISIVTLIAAGKDALKLIKQIDYKTLLFFIGLFMVVGGLEQTGILKVMANFIGDISNGNLMLMIAIILWISAIASAFVDNIPFAATMIPIISSLSAAQGVDLSILAWALAMGTDIGGSATPIGASANVVGIATAAKAGHMIKWGKYCKVMAPATIIVVGISMLMIYARYL